LWCRGPNKHIGRAACLRPLPHSLTETSVKVQSNRKLEPMWQCKVRTQLSIFYKLRIKEHFLHRTTKVCTFTNSQCLDYKFSKLNTWCPFDTICIFFSSQSDLVSLYVRPYYDKTHQTSLIYVILIFKPGGNPIL